MRAQPKDLVQQFQGNGELFEDFVHDLVRGVVRYCKVDPLNNTVAWDYRTHVADGGRDLEIRVGNPRGDKSFYPQRPSLWSMKSGNEGVSPSSLKSEIRDARHPKVRERLAAGWVYVWCAIHPASIDKRDEMRQAANEIAEEFQFDPIQIEFRSPEDLAAEANLYPNIIPAHLPNVALAFKDLMPLNQWKNELKLADQWVNFGDRATVLGRVTQHFLSREPPNVLHVAGLSGIGKTRTIFEACRANEELKGVFYVERFEHIEGGAHELYRYLREDGRNIYLVLDETRLEQIETIKGRFAEYADRVRVVTIGPAIRQPPVSRDDVMILSEPETDSGVLEIVRTAGPQLSPDVQKSIADWSSQDLNLALLLVEASKQIPEYRGVPLVDIDAVWERLMRLFTTQIGDKSAFRERYEVLTTSVDVGVAEDATEEVVALALFFGKHQDQVRSAADIARKCGLGIRTRRFFEATPRALAARLFETSVWPRIRDRLDEFGIVVIGPSSRLGRRFLERCEDCAGPVREEVEALLGDYFLRALHGADITVLASRESSRLFQEWAEFDPRRGLLWLRRAVERATSEQLRALDGEADGSGGWRGRRQLVWLCQNLASFGEYFEDCEAVLFRLAMHESEPSIGNNSTIMWQSLFWPGLGGTSKPFNERLPSLIRRLRDATAEEIPLVLAAAIGCIEPRRLGLPMPPAIVGGRVAPKPWRPATWNELHALQRTTAQEVVEIVRGMNRERWHAAVLFLSKHVRVFGHATILGELKRSLTAFDIDEPLRLLLIVELNRYLDLLRSIKLSPNQEPLIPILEQWVRELSPDDLPSRVRSLTAQNYWSTRIGDDRQLRYDDLADELIRSEEVFRTMGDWLGSAEAKSGGQLAWTVGRRDSDGKLSSTIQEWLRAGLRASVVSNYLGGQATGHDGLPSNWSTELDTAATTHPGIAASITAAADVSARGFERLIRAIDQIAAPASRFLRPLAFGNWLQVLTEKEQIVTLNTLKRLADTGDLEATAVGMDLIRMWEHVHKRPLSSEMALVALSLASNQPSTRNEFHDWQQVLLALCQFHPREVAELITGFMTTSGNVGKWMDEEIVEILGRAASFDPTAVMEVVGAAVIDQKRRTIFGVATIQGMFEAIGLKSVSEWVSKHGGESLPWLARHFQSPYLNNEGRPVIPPLTEWLFRDHEANQKAFEWFCMGRSDRAFSETEVDPARKRMQMQPFLSHELRRVREWAEYEIKVEENEASFLQEWREEDERR
jgi:hypothetical protein